MREGIRMGTLRAEAFSGAASVDLSTFFPGTLAATHTLRALDGRHYRFEGDAVNRLWSRSIDPGYTDWQAWAPDGLYYLGWFSPTGVHWAVGPDLAMPRFWNPAVPWSRSYPAVMAHRDEKGTTVTTSTTAITLQATVERGEDLYVLHGVNGTSEEHWWVSSCIPIRGGGCAPGLRGYAIVEAGAVTASGEFVEWTERS